MQNFNYHTHTYRCGHADYNLKDEDYVKLFIQKGFRKIAFTDHMPDKSGTDTRKRMRMDYSQKDEYLNSIKYLKEKYKDIIDIETGFEIEFLPGQEQNLLELKKEVDKLVLGQHFIYEDGNNRLKIFRYQDFSHEDLLKYASYIVKAMELGIPDIIVHPDLFMLSRDSFTEKEAEVAHIICKAAEKYDIPLEINLTEANLLLIGKREKITYPCKEFWNIVKDYNIKVLYGVDAHYESQIINYEKSIEIVNNLIGNEIIEKLNFIGNVNENKIPDSIKNIRLSMDRF